MSSPPQSSIQDLHGLGLPFDPSPAPSLTAAGETKGNTCERYDADAGLFSWGNAPPEPFLIPLQPQRAVLRSEVGAVHPARLARSNPAGCGAEQVRLFSE